LEKRVAAARGGRLQDGGVEEEGMRLLSVASTHDYSVQESVRMARNLDLDHLRQERIRAKEADAAIVAFEKEHTDAACAALTRARPDLKLIASSFTATPSPVAGTSMVRVNKESLVHGANTIMQYVKTFNQSHGNLLQAMDKQVAHFSRMIDEPDEVGNSSDDDDSEQEELCYRLRICVHTERGERAFEFRNSMLAFMKRSFPRSCPRLRERLKGGEFFVALCGVPAVDDDQADMLCLEPMTVWWHLSEHTWNPYDTMVMRMLDDLTEEEQALCGVAPHEIALKVYLIILRLSFNQNRQHYYVIKTA